MDVWETKDGVLVVHHDRSLKRTCGVNRDIADLNLRELPPFCAEVELDFTEEVSRLRTRGETIPTLEEVFRRFPGVAMSVEVKQASGSLITELRRLVLKHDRLAITLVGTGTPWSAELSSAFPEGNRFFSYASLPRLFLLYLTGLLPFCPLEEKALQLPLHTEAYQAMRTRSHGPTWANRLYFWAVQASYFFCRPLIWHLRQRGIMTFYWVCNTNSEFERAARGGCCGIMTDDPVLLHRFLRQGKEEGGEGNG
jgi:glycerophosphoryl diester phosphodiesterase